MNSQYKDEWLNKAFQLAFFIHGEKATALEIAACAMNKLETASNAQFKRYYYTPTGRAENARAARSRVSLNDLQLLQRLVLVESEIFEKEKETRKTIGEDALLKHFIKHLVRISLKRNSFYVTLGISRILHNYATNDVMDIYNIVVQDPERVHDDYYYRSRKGVLMKELKQRFGDLLSVVKANRGEERFDKTETDEAMFETVKECLKSFTPWNSSCAIPEKFNPLDDIIKSFYFDKKDPDEEHRIEINRIHAALHPECFNRLTEALKLPPSAEKMEIPKFMITTDRQNSDRNNPQNPPNLGTDELQAIKDRLTAQAENRRAFAANFLRVLVDGNERAEINLKAGEKYNFDLDASEELIEVRAADDLVLATHLLSFDELQKGNLQQSIQLENGREISFDLMPKMDEYGEITSVNCGIGFVGKEESAPFSFDAWLEKLNWFLKPALAFGLGMVLLGFGWFVWRQIVKNEEIVKDEIVPTENINREIIVREPPKELPKELPKERPEKPKTEKPASTENKAVRPDSIEKKIEKPTPQKEKNIPPKREIREVPVPREFQAQNKDFDDEGNLRLPIYGSREPRENTGRNTPNKITGMALSEIKNVYIEISGDEFLSKPFAEQIKSEILKSERFLLTTDKENADAVLKIYIRHESDVDEPSQKMITAIIRLVNAKGFVVFPSQKGVSGWKYIGEIGKLPKRIAGDLNAAK